MDANSYIRICIYMCIALLVGAFICYIYKKCFFFREGIYSKAFTVTLIGMTVMTCMVTIAISTNIVISLGMVGSLSIVRYRTAVKEPLDLLYLFWAITSGITIGTGMFWLVGLGSVIMTVCLVLSAKLEMAKALYLVIVHYSNMDVKSEILKCLENEQWKMKSIVVREDQCEMTLQITAPQNSNYQEKIQSISGVKDITVITYNGEYQS